MDEILEYLHLKFLTFFNKYFVCLQNNFPISFIIITIAIVNFITLKIIIIIEIIGKLTVILSLFLKLFRRPIQPSRRAYF